MHPLLINLGYGRSGTTFAYNLLRANLPEAVVWHERLSARQARRVELFRCDALARPDDAGGADGPTAWDPSAEENAAIAAMLDEADEVLRTQPLVILGGTMSHLAPLLIGRYGADRVSTFHLHRHPFLVSAAALTSSGPDMWTDIPLDRADRGRWKLTPLEDRVAYPELRSVWDGLSPYCRMAYQWLEQTRYAADFPALHPEVGSLDLPSQSLFADPRRLVDFARERLGLGPRGSIDVPANQNATWLRNRERNPLGERDWMAARELEPLVAFGESLGYEFGVETLRGRLAKYALPDGWSSRLRHATGYWRMRERLAASLRRIGLVPPRQIDHDGSQPRSAGAAIAEAGRHLVSGGSRR